MDRNFLKIVLIIILPVIYFGQSSSYAHKKFQIKSNEKVDNEKVDNEIVSYKKNKSINKIESNKKNKVSLQNKFDNDFKNYKSFEESVKPMNQFKSLFGVGGFSDQRLKDSSFDLWATYEEEMSKQIGIKKLNGPDINNTFNESLNTLEN